MKSIYPVLFKRYVKLCSRNRNKKAINLELEIIFNNNPNITTLHNIGRGYLNRLLVYRTKVKCKWRERVVRALISYIRKKKAVLLVNKIILKTSNIKLNLMNQDKQKYAAMSIQRAYKGYMHKIKIKPFISKDNNRSVVTIQKYWRGYKDRKIYGTLLRHYILVAKKKRLLNKKHIEA